jgi:hypothetical protein
VKIRSDDEIDNYNEKQFLKEKASLRQVDGYTLIDYIKSSVEVLIDMKMEDEAGDNDDGGDGTHFNSSVRSVALLMSHGNTRRKRTGSESKAMAIKQNMDEEIMLRSPKGAIDKSKIIVGEVALK